MRQGLQGAILISKESKINCTNYFNHIKVPGTNTTIPKGMHVTLSARGISMDERFFPDPKTFNPENFSKKNKETRNPVTNDIGFSIGPRNSIGSILKICE